MLCSSRRELTDKSSVLRLPRGTIIPGRSLPNPYFKTSKDGGSLNKPPGDFFFFFFLPSLGFLILESFSSWLICVSASLARRKH